MTNKVRADKDAAYLPSIQRMIHIVGDPQADLNRKLRRLTSIVVGDFPHALFKLQIIGPDSMLRVVPEFVTPMLQRVVDRYRSTLGPLDIRDAVLPTGTDSMVEAGILSHDEIRLIEPADIARYFSAHFNHADREQLGDGGVTYWRTVAAVITVAYRESTLRLVSELRRLALSTVDVPTVLLDAGGTPIDANRSVTAMLGFADREATIRHLGNMKTCFPSRDAMTRGPAATATPDSLYVSDAFGTEIACTVDTRTLSDREGNVAGAVVRLYPTEDLHERSVRLTRRQREVARLIADGLTSKEVAFQLGLSIHTVHYHRAQIREQLSGEDTGGDLATTLRHYFLGNR